MEHAKKNRADGFEQLSSLSIAATLEIEGNKEQQPKKANAAN
jgi:hypothetical protein